MATHLNLCRATGGEVSTTKVRLEPDIRASRPSAAISVSWKVKGVICVTHHKVVYEENK